MKKFKVCYEILSTKPKIHTGSFTTIIEAFNATQIRQMLEAQYNHGDNWVNIGYIMPID